MPTKKKKVAIIDDEPMILNMYSLKLEHANFDVTRYPDGRSAIKGIMKNQPDLILLDIIMPGIDGIKVLRELKSHQRTRGIPVILLTNLDDGEIRRKGAKSGALYFLNKAMFMPKAVVKMVSEVLA